MKLCKRCNKVKDEKSFSAKGKYLQSYCKSCNKEMRNAARRNYKVSLFKDIKNKYIGVLPIDKLTIHYRDNEICNICYKHVSIEEVCVRLIDKKGKYEYRNLELVHYECLEKYYKDRNDKIDRISEARKAREILQ